MAWALNGMPANRRPPLGACRDADPESRNRLCHGRVGSSPWRLRDASPPVPGYVVEQLWFDKATGYDINHVPHEIRMRGAIGYPRTDQRFYRVPPPELVDEP
jgi:hypothetical protein